MMPPNATSNAATPAIHVDTSAEEKYPSGILLRQREYFCVAFRGVHPLGTGTTEETIAVV